MKIALTLKRLAYSAAITCALSIGVQAQQSELVPFQTMQDSQGWDAVGRLDIRGKGFCTAALIRERLILTAAHCLYDEDGTRVDPGRFEFRAGLRDGRAEATRNISRTIPHPEYSFKDDAIAAPAVALDIAVLELDRPVRMSRLRPYLIAPRPLAMRIWPERYVGVPEPGAWRCRSIIICCSMIIWPRTIPNGGRSTQRVIRSNHSTIMCSA